jgi:hypothetical protein
MSSSFSSNQQLPFLSGFSGRDRETTAKALARQEARRRKALEARSEQIERSGERLDRKFHDLLGARKWAEFQGALQRERLAFRKTMQPPDGLSRDYRGQKRVSRRRMSALLSKLGASQAKLKRITAEFHESLEGLRPPFDGKIFPGYNLAENHIKWASLSPLHEHALPWGVQLPLPDPNDPYRWFLFRPPFFGFLFSFAPQATSGFVSDRTLFLAPNAGLVGNEVTMDATDPGDYGAASGTAESQIAFGFVPPVAGLVEIIIDAQNSMGEHSIDITDNFGFSNAWAYQHNYLMANVLHPNVVEPSIAEMSTASADTDGDDEHVQQVNLTRGQHYFAHLFSAGPVPAGQSVVVTVGTRTFDIARANDMELHSRSNFQWFINSVEVRIAP